MLFPSVGWTLKCSRVTSKTIGRNVIWTFAPLINWNFINGQHCRLANRQNWIETETWESYHRLKINAVTPPRTDCRTFNFVSPFVSHHSFGVAGQLRSCWDLVLHANIGTEEMQHINVTVSWIIDRDGMIRCFSRFRRNLHAAVPTSWMKGRPGVASLDLRPSELLGTTISHSVGLEGEIMLFSDTILLFTCDPLRWLHDVSQLSQLPSSLLALVFLFVSTVKLLSPLVAHVCRSVRWKISFSAQPKASVSDSLSALIKPATPPLINAAMNRFDVARG